MLLTTPPVLTNARHHLSILPKINAAGETVSATSLKKGYGGGSSIFSFGGKGGSNNSSAVIALRGAGGGGATSSSSGIRPGKGGDGAVAFYY